MKNQDQENNLKERSFKDLVIITRSFINYLKSKWIIILIVSIAGAAMGLGYSILKKPLYTAICTFVLDDSKSGSSLGQYSGLASLAGINVGTGGGMFEGDNILELYKSRMMIEKSLLSTYLVNGKSQLLIDRFIDKYNFRKSWKDDKTLNKISFSGNPENFSREQDSVITDLVELFNKSILTVEKPDKKLDIISVTVVTKDELFSKLFTEQLVQNVNDFYIQTKIKKIYENVQILQHQADSVRAILNSSLNGVASAIDAAPNANPLLSTLKVSSQKKQVDVQSNSAIFSQIVQNLELAKISLMQETPLIQVIDKPVLPLAKNRVSKIKGILMGVFLGFFIAVLFLSIKNLYHMLLNKPTL